MRVLRLGTLGRLDIMEILWGRRGKVKRKSEVGTR